MSTLAEPRLPNPIPRDVPRTQDMSTQPRKRRKRATASGATADCFTCTSRGITCDRKRPYCAQCLDNSLDCGGYRTQLTWGVGVASRGKLRGLTLPVAGTKKTAEIGSATKSKKGRTSNTPELENVPASAPISISAQSQTPNVFHPVISPPQGSSVYPDTSWVTQFPVPTNDFYSQSNGTSAAHLQIPVSQPDQRWTDQSGSFLATSIPVSSPSYPPSATSTTFSNTPYDDYCPSYNGSVLSGSVESDYTGTPMYSPYSIHEPLWQHTPNFPDAHESIPRSVGTVSDCAIEDDDVEEIQRTYDDDWALSEPYAPRHRPFRFNFNMPLMALSGTNGVGKTGRMQYLINYYAEVISPVIVAFDGPNNPFRVEVLKLATKSETLQHALSALSASNLRRRRETGLISTGKTAPARRSSMAHRTLTDEAYHGLALLSPEDQIREESFHKNVAVKQLNEQLANPVLRKDDAILATLLILCLFHMCDSGIARFQTQFAGVRKLLTLRGDHLGTAKEESKWMMRIFSWYDAFAATVNDREAQFSGFQRDPSSSGGEWSYANLGGIDGRLFETISRLGRLNMLAQGQNEATRCSPNLVSKPTPSISAPYGTAYGGFNSNDWMRILDDENLFARKTESSNLSQQFWREWREIRQDLQTWTLDFSFESASPSQQEYMSEQAHYHGADYYYTLTAEQRLDLSHVSDSFRFASLLYTERLADPSLPSDHPTIQHWVRKSLEHIVRVQSDTYLLWPLFITGTEVVHEDERKMIRRRCWDIQRDSGFVNNASCLELLEKVWKKGDKERQRQAAAYGEFMSITPLATTSKSQSALGTSTFRFRDVMLAEENDGEYFVL